MTLGTRHAQAAAKKLAKATPGSRTVKRVRRWRGWMRLLVKFDAGFHQAAVCALAAQCQALRVKRYLDMGQHEQPFGSARTFTATSPSASVRIVEQYFIVRDEVDRAVEAVVAR